MEKQAQTWHEIGTKKSGIDTVLRLPRIRRHAILNTLQGISINEYATGTAFFTRRFCVEPSARRPHLLQAPFLLGHALPPDYPGGYCIEKASPLSAASAICIPQPFWEEEIPACSRTCPLHGRTVLPAGQRRPGHAHYMGSGKNHHAGRLQQDPRLPPSPGSSPLPSPCCS